MSCVALDKSEQAFRKAARKQTWTDELGDIGVNDRSGRGSSAERTPLERQAKTESESSLPPGGLGGHCYGNTATVAPAPSSRHVS